MPKKAELTIVVDCKKGQVLYSSFITVLNNTVGLLNSMGRKLAKTDSPDLVWQITSVSMNSPLTITLKGQSARGRDLPRRAIRDYVQGIQRIQEKRERPARFEDTDLDQVSKLASVLYDGVKSLRFSAEPFGEVCLTKVLAENAQNIQRRRYHYEYTSFRGRLNDIRTSFGAHECVVRDFLTNQEIRCTYPEKRDSEIAALLLKRVEVSGKAKFTERGQLVSIQIDRFQELPAARLKISDAKAVDITGGMDSVEYIRKIRNGEVV